MIINAVNLIDGLDGLASGVTVIALASIAVIAILQNNIFVMMISVILIGSTLGVLYYNFYPAKLFLGDNGSMFLGYVLGVLSLSLIHISEPTRRTERSRMPSSA